MARDCRRGRGRRGAGGRRPPRSRGQQPAPRAVRDRDPRARHGGGARCARPRTRGSRRALARRLHRGGACDRSSGPCGRAGARRRRADDPPGARHRPGAVPRSVPRTGDRASEDDVPRSRGIPSLVGGSPGASPTATSTRRSSTSTPTTTSSASPETCARRSTRKRSARTASTCSRRPTRDRCRPPPSCCAPRAG